MTHLPSQPHQSEDCELYRSLFERAPIGLFAIAPDGRFLKANGALAGLCGYESVAQFLTAHPTRGSLYSNGDRCAELRATLLTAHTSDGSKERHLTNVHSQWAGFNQQPIWVEETLWTVRDALGNVLRFEGIAREIPLSAKQINQQLTLPPMSEVQLNEILDNSIAVIASIRVLDTETWQYDYISASSIELLGYSPQAYIADRRLWMSQILPEDAERLLPELLRVILESGTTNLECRYRHPLRGLRWLYVNLYSRWQEPGHWSVTLMATDITERKQVELALKEQEEKLRSITSNVPVYIYELDAAGTITFVNRTYANLTAEQVVGTQLEAWFPLEQRPSIQQCVQRVFQTGQLQTLEYAIPNSEGELRSYQTQITPVAVDGTVTSAILLAADITDRKLAESAVQFQANLLSQVQNAVICSDLEGRITYWNAFAEKLYQWTSEEVLGRSIRETITPLDQQTRMTDAFSSLAQDATMVGEYELQRKDGSRFHAFASTTAIYNAQGQVTGYVGVSLDITSVKHTERALRESENRFQRIAANLPGVVYRYIMYLDGSDQFAYISPRCHEVFEVEPVAVLQDASLLWSLIVPEDAQEMRVAIAHSIEAHSPWSSEFRIICTSGKQKWLRAVAQLDRQPDGTVIWDGFVFDVSDRKQIESQLQQNEALMRATFDQAAVGICVDTLTGQHLQINQKFCDIVGYDIAELHHLSWQQITHPDDVEKDQRLTEQLLAGKLPHFSLEKRYLRREGAIVWVNLTLSLILDAAGVPQNTLAVIEDITVRKQTELALRESERRNAENLLELMEWRQRYEAAGRAGSQMLYDYDVKLVRAKWGANSEQVLGYTVEEMYSIELVSFGQMIHPDDRVHFQQALEQLLLYKVPFRGIEYRLYRKDGTCIWVEDSNELLLDEAGNLVRVIGFLADISDRKRTEADLRESEARFRQLVDTMREGFFVAEGSQTMNYLYVSPSFEHIFGIPCEQFYQEPLIWLQVLHPEDRNRVETSLYQELEGIPFEEEYRVLHADETQRWVRSQAFPIVDDTGVVTRIVGVVEDITARKQAEAQIRASLEEKEALLAEIHHRVKNNLQIISSLLHLQANRIDDPQVHRVLEDSWNRVKSMALVHETLYQSNDFTHINFSDYLQALASNLFSSYNVDPDAASLSIDVGSPVSLSLSKAIPCGLIVNELVTNALKYGLSSDRRNKIDQKDEIMVRLGTDDEGQVALTVGNRGDTLPLNFDALELRSMGLRLVRTLVHQLEGTLTIERGDPTLFKVVFHPSAVLDERD